MVERLLKRSDFLKTARGTKQVRRALVLQARVRAESDYPHSSPRVGFTVTKKLGNAVTRNRIRRRLKEAARLAETDALANGLPPPFLDHTDYVIIGRKGVGELEFSSIRKDLSSALKKINHDLRHKNLAEDQIRSKKDKKPPSNPSH